MFLNSGVYWRLDPSRVYLLRVVRAEALIENMPSAAAVWLDSQDEAIKRVAFRLLTDRPDLFVKVLWNLGQLPPRLLPPPLNVPACGSLLMALAGLGPTPRGSLPEKPGEAKILKAKHGELRFGGMALPLNKLQSLSGGLNSRSAQGRHGASKAIRGKDSVFTPMQTLIRPEWIIQNRFALQKLAFIASGCEAIFSLERGGSLVADHITAQLRDRTPNVKVPKVTERGAPYNKQDHINRFKQAIRQHIGLDTPARQVTIGVTETVVGGSSANTVMGALNSMLRDHPNLSVRFLFERHTFHRDADVKLFEELRITGQTHAREIFPNESLIVPSLSGGAQVIAFLANARYILGEDVGYQLDYDGPCANQPLVIFDMIGQQLRAVSIQPSGGHTAREMIVRLVLGAYDDVLREAGLL